MSGPKITVEQLEKLNTRENAAIAYRGKVYDVTGFLDKHPGGSDKLLLVAGKDVTGYFDSYHKKSIRGLIPHKCKYLGELEDANAVPKFHEKDEFYETLEERFLNYFKTNNIDPKIHIPYFCFAAAVILATPFLWYLAVLSVHLGYSPFVSCCLTLLYGWMIAQVTFFAHETTHFLWTHKPWVWNMSSMIIASLQGFSGYVWSYEHVFGHHTYPNHSGLDPDMATQDVDVRRIKPFQNWLPHYRFQHIYLPLFYVFIGTRQKLLDFYSLLVLRKFDITFNKPSVTDLLEFTITKAIHIYYRFILPYSYISITSLLLLNVVAEIVMGFLLGTFSQVSHINADVDYTNFENVVSISEPVTWSQMQISATMDYATDSHLWNVLTGGLNCQVCHHLFPQILSIYFVDLAPIMKQTCMEFGVKYNYHNSFWEAWCSHIKHLKILGQVKYE